MTVRRVTAVAGLCTFVLLFAGQALFQVGGGEPAFDAPAADISAFFASRDETLFPIGGYLSSLGLVTMLWFLGGTYTLLKGDWRGVVALVSGGVFVAVVSGAGGDLVVFRQAEGVDPQIARLVFDMGNMAFATSWMALGSFAIATGLALMSTGTLPSWLGWWGLAAGGCLVVARAAWTTEAYLLGYFLFWFWVVALCVVLLRRVHPVRAAPAVADRAAPR